MDLAIIGGGPVGLEAAARAARMGLATVLFEAGEVADHVRAWGWLRLFSPFEWNAGPAGLEVLRGQGGELPAAEALLTGAELRHTICCPWPRPCGRAWRSARARAYGMSPGRTG